MWKIERFFVWDGFNRNNIFDFFIRITGRSKNKKILYILCVSLFLKQSCLNLTSGLPPSPRITSCVEGEVYMGSHMRSVDPSSL